MLVRIQSRPFKAHIKASRTALATLGFHFHPLRARKPIIGVIISINKWDPHLLCVPNIFLLSNLIFFERVNIRVIKENRKLNIRGDHRLHQLASTRRAARMEQNRLLAVWRF